MASNGNGREKVIDYLIRNLTEGRASRELNSSMIEEGLNELKIELREDNGCYWGYLRADDGEERWVSWGEVEDNLRQFYGLFPGKVISGETEIEKDPSRKEEVVLSVIVDQPAKEGVESLEEAVSVGAEAEERVAIPAASVDPNPAVIEEAISLSSRSKPEPKPADELPADVQANDEEVEVQKINRYSILFKGLGVGIAATVVMGLGAAIGYSIRDFYARNETKTETVCPAAEAKDCPDAVKLVEKNKTLASKLDKIQTKVKQTDANNNYLAERKVSAENDYVDCMLGTAGQGLALVESNSALEQCNNASKQGGEDYASLEKRLEESSRENRAKTDFLVSQSLSWYAGFSEAVNLWLDAEGRYGNALQTGIICAQSWENEQILTLTYIADRDAAVAERDGAVLELGDHLAEAQAVFDQAEACEQKEKEKDGELEIYAQKEGDWVRKDDAYQTKISEIERELTQAKGDLERKITDYTALESSSKQELEKKQEELAQLQAQLARVQEQLKITEESNTSYSQEKSSSVSDLTKCRDEQDLVRKESSRVGGLLEEKTREYQSLVNSFGEERKKAQEQLVQVEEQLKTEKEKNSGCSAEGEEKERNYSHCAEERDRFRAQSDQNRSELETCLDERREALAEQSRIQEGLDDCVEEKERWYNRSLSVKYEDGKEQICYEDGIPHETPLESGEVLSMVNVSCVSKEEWRYNSKNLIAKAVSSSQAKESEAAVKQKRAEKPAEISTIIPAEDYLHKPTESNAPLREENYYGQLIANPVRVEEIALAYVEEHGGSITVCGKNNREKAVSLYEQIAPEGRDDVYTLEFFVKGTSEFYQGMDAKTPYCVPLTVIEE